MVGKSISHYKILEKLGEGGMGVVYKAHDTKLNRIVALKFLPVHVADNHGERLRFLQEAQTAALLNHPNICIIYGIHDVQERHFIEMEFIDGETLRKKIESSPLIIQDALSYALQTADALQEAHAKGIVHRDIKADNVMVNTKNQIKVMDFGLAKLKGSLKLTRTFSTVGTLGYMAPEQIQGGQADIRSDIFSFGVLLFEMLTGRFPFRGEHEAAMIYSIVNEAPEPIAKYLPGVSSDLVHMLDKSLEKDPEDRYQSISEIVVDLRRLLKQTGRISKTVPIVQAGKQGLDAVARKQTGHSRAVTKRITVFGGIGALILVAAVLYFWTRFGGYATATMNPEFASKVLAIPSLQAFYPGLSADGNWLAFPAADANDRWDIYYMHTSRGDARRITSDSATFVSDVSADISPDGSEIAYNRWNTTTGVSEIFVVSSLGGDKKLVTPDGILARWRPDGQRIGFVRPGKSPRALLSFWSAASDGSDPRMEYADSLSAAGRFSYAWSPDGKSIAWIRSFEGGAYQEVFTRNLKTGVERQLTFDRKNIDDVCWTKRRVIIFSSNKSGNTNLWMVPAEGGVAQQITKGSGPDIGIASSTDSQKIVYLQQQSTGNVWIAGFDGKPARQLTFEDRDINSAAISPDGKRIAFTMGDIDPLRPNVHLYVENIDGTDRKQIIPKDVITSNPSWSPDGKYLAFTMRSTSQPPDSDMAYTIATALWNPLKPVYRGTNVRWTDPTEFVALAPGGMRNVLVSLGGSPPRDFYKDSTRSLPDATGRLIVFQDLRKGREGLWTVAADYSSNPADRKPRRILSDEQLTFFAGASGKYIYWIDRNNELWRMNMRGEAKERVKGIFPGLTTGFRVFPREDDKGMAYIVRKRSGRLVLIDNLFR